MKRILRVLCSALFIGIAGCGGGGGESRGTTQTPITLEQGAIISQGASDTGIEGTVMATIPELVPGSIRFRREPVQAAALSIVRVLDNDEVGQIYTDTAGRFSVELPPDRYLLVPRNVTVGSSVLRAPAQTIPVFPGQISRIAVEYESALLQTF